MSKKRALILRAEEAFYEAVELGLFEVDVEGFIWRVAKFSTNGRGDKNPCVRHRAEIDLSGSKTDGYRQVKVVFPGGIIARALAHRVVWRHFRGSIPEGLTINHKDGVKSNNALGNLELATHREQKQHAIHVLGQKAFPSERRARGERCATAKLTEDQIREIRAATGWGVTRRMADKFGMCMNSIGLIRTRRTWKHVA